MTTNKIVDADGEVVSIAALHLIQVDQHLSAPRLTAQELVKFCEIIPGAPAPMVTVPQIDPFGVMTFHQRIQVLWTLFKALFWTKKQETCGSIDTVELFQKGFGGA